jgi:hypothetical protein
MPAASLAHFLPDFSARSDSEGIEPDETVQVDLAIRMLKALYRAEESASARP